MHKYVYLPDESLHLTSVTTLVKMFSHGFDERSHAIDKAIADGVSVESVLATWKEKRESASSNGTAAHYEAELCAKSISRHGFINGVHARRSVTSFFNDHPEICFHPIYPELRVVDLEFGLAGTVDLLCMLDGVASIVDYKLVGKLDFIGYHTKCYSPWNCFNDCNGYLYLLQLCVYASILRRQYGIDCKQIAICHLVGDSYRLVRLTELKERAERVLMKWQKERQKVLD